MFVNVGFPSTSFGVYQPYIVQAPGMSDASGSFVLTIRNLSSLITMLFVAFYYKKFDCKMGIFIATIFTCIGFVVFSFSDNLFLFCIAAILAGIGYGLGGSAGMTLLIGKWFKNNTGKAIGFATIGSSLAGILVPMFVLFIVSFSSINYAFMWQAIFALLIAVFLLVFIKNKPDNLTEKKLKTQDSFSQFKLTKFQYYLYVFGVFLVGGACLSDIYFLSILFTSSGGDAVLGATVVTVANISLCLGKFVLGVLFDRFGTFKGTIISFCFIICGIILLCIAPGNEFLPYLAAAIFGFGTALTTVGISQWSIDLSININREKTVRDFQTAYAAGGFVTSMFPGLIAQFSGNYAIFYYISLVIVLISATIILKLYPNKK